MRRQDWPSGSRDARRALRAHHFVALIGMSYHLASPARQSEWEADLVALNLLLRGGKVGRVENVDLAARRGFARSCIEWRTASKASRGRAWAVGWICKIRDQSALYRRQQVVICQRRAGVTYDLMCAYNALITRWRRVIGSSPWAGTVPPCSCRLSKGRRMANEPVFCHSNGVAFGTGDMRHIAQHMATACGEDTLRFRATSFRVGAQRNFVRARCGRGHGGGQAARQVRIRHLGDLPARSRI